MVPRSRCCVAPWQHSAGHDYGHLHGRSAYGKAVRTDADIIALISALTELRGAQSNPCNLPPTAYLQSASGDKALFGRSTVNFRSLNAGTSGSGDCRSNSCRFRTPVGTAAETRHSRFVEQTGKSNAFILAVQFKVAKATWRVRCCRR